MAKKIFELYVTISFIFNLAHSFFFATYSVFLKSCGLNMLEINLINCFFMITVFLMEVPTGAFADHFGRKKSVILSCAFFSLGMFVYYKASGFWSCALAEILAAVGTTFFSGAMEAWAYDALHFHNFEGDFLHVLERKTRFDQYGTIISMLIGSCIARIDIALPWLAGGIGMILVGIFCWKTMPLDHYHEKRESFSLAPIAKIAHDGMRFAIAQKAILHLACFGAIMTFTVQAYNMYWPLIFKEKYGIPVEALGLVFFGSCLFIILGNRLSKKIANHFQSELHGIAYSQLITALGMILAAFMFGSTSTLIGFYIHEIGRGALDPIKKNFLHGNIPSEKRATILSFDSMANKGGAFAGLLFSGGLAQYYSIPVSWMTSGIILLVSVFVFLNFNSRKYDH